MEIRVLRYFLEMAREGNMTRAAERLHVTQPTLSRQIRDLEDELGKKLFTRTNYSINLTEAGMLLRERAEDILDIVDKTEAEFRSMNELNSGDVYVGCAESDSIKYFARAVKNLQLQYPNICCNMYSGNMQDVTEKLDKGVLDFAIIMKYVDNNKYNYLNIPEADVWGLFVPKNDKIASKESLSIDELLNLPLICSRQWYDQDAAEWFGDKYNRLNIVASFNLAYNAFVMVREGIGYALAYDKLTYTGEHSDLRFIPIKNAPTSPMKIIWRKYQTFTPAATLFYNELKEQFGEN